MITACNPIMKQVYETGFALDDIVLYLNSHPTDIEALNYYYYMKQLRDDAVNNYEATYGSLFNYNVNANDWNWINDPWPWEGEC